MSRKRVPCLCISTKAKLGTPQCLAELENFGGNYRNVHLFNYLLTTSHCPPPIKDLSRFLLYLSAYYRVSAGINVQLKWVHFILAKARFWALSNPVFVLWYLPPPPKRNTGFNEWHSRICFAMCTWSLKHNQHLTLIRNTWSKPSFLKEAQ